MRKTPLRLMTLQLSHMGFTLARTFIMYPLQIARPNLAALDETVVVMHPQMPLNLRHGIQINSYHNQKRGSADQKSYLYWKIK